MGSMDQNIVPQIIVIDKLISIGDKVVLGNTKEINALGKVNCTNLLQGSVPMYGAMIRSKLNDAI